MLDGSSARKYAVIAALAVLFLAGVVVVYRAIYQTAEAVGIDQAEKLKRDSLEGIRDSLKHSRDLTLPQELIPSGR